jgi:hypothetical protein
MSNKRQTAVEWLEKQIKDHALIKPALITGFEILLFEAKEMDKQQKMDAFMEGDSFEGLASKKDFEQYYTETYNTTNP